MSPILIVGGVALLAFLVLGRKKPSAAPLNTSSAFECATKIADAMIARPEFGEFLEVPGAPGIVNEDVVAQIHACSEAGDLMPCRTQLISATAQVLEASTPDVLRKMAKFAQDLAPELGIHQCISAIADKKEGR